MGKKKIKIDNRKLKKEKEINQRKTNDNLKLQSDKLGIDVQQLQRDYGWIYQSDNGFIIGKNLSLNNDVYKLIDTLGAEKITKLINSPSFKVDTTCYDDDDVWQMAWHNSYYGGTNREMAYYYLSEKLRPLGINVDKFIASFFGDNFKELSCGGSCKRCGTDETIYQCRICSETWCDDCFGHRVHMCRF